MKLPREAIIEFQDSWLAVTGEKIGFAEAEKQAITFLSMMRNVLQPAKSRDSLKNNGPP